MSKPVSTKDLLLGQLRKTPIVQIACEKVGVHQATYYRWRQADTAFAEAADEALAEGSKFVNDMAESQLLAAIRERNLTAIIFWLKHHHTAYTTRVEVEAQHRLADTPLSPEQQATVTEALKLAGLAKPDDVEGGDG